jgi:hypothetical protein
MHRDWADGTTNFLKGRVARECVGPISWPDITDENQG